MGLLTGSGCLSRVMGPVFVTYIYTNLGTNFTFGLTTIMMALSMIWLLFVTKRLITKLQYEEAGTELKDINTFDSIALNDDVDDDRDDDEKYDI